MEFRFCALEHRYTDMNGREIPHITGLLKASGWVDDAFYTAASAARGHVVHRLTADYDLGAIEDPNGVLSECKGYLLAYAGARSLLQPTFLKIEEPMVHPVFRFGGRPDRVVTVGGRRGTLEIKSGAEAKSHPIQTALQAILDEAESGIPAKFAYRGSVYVTAKGRYKVIEHRDERDIREAWRIIKAYAC